jgi:hypothetical protein
VRSTPPLTLVALLALAGACRDRSVPAARDAAPRPADAAAATTADGAAAPPTPAGASTPEVLDHAAAWLAAFPADELRFDAAIGLAALRRHHDTADVRRAEAAARAVADRDADNPLRRAFDPAHRAARSTASWDVPAAGAPRANVNRVVAEALHCDVHGLRDATLDYLGGAMRDGGGYHTAHGLWALVFARDAGCIDAARFDAAAAPLRDELRAAQPAVPGPAVLDVDLFAERLLMLVLAGERGAAVDGWARALAAAQHADGGFGAPDPAAPSYHRYHATMAAAWALAEAGAASSRP